VNPRIVEAMSVKTARQAMEKLNVEDLKSLNMDFLTPEVEKLLKQCQTYLEKYSVGD